ncbi:MAG: WYL domain-containing protein [Bacteroidales bacterium]|jgi:predicted DNA-binding transcriptional regulator YafY
MSKRESIARYNLIIKKLRKHPSTYAEIAGYLALESELQGYDFNVSQRTFQRDIQDISSLYNIDIQYDFSKKVYHILYDDQPQVNERILEAFDIFNALNMIDRLSDHIHFEKRRPQGTGNLYGLLHAIKNRLQVSFLYEKFWEEDISVRHACPYALKEFKNRWYVIVNDLKDNKVKTFGLDRLSGLEITRTKFKMPADFNVNERFANCFGIISPNGPEPEDIVLSFNPLQGKYIKTLPLHESQQILKDNDRELLVKLTLFVTHDLLMEILSYGDNVKVIHPAGLVDEIRECYENALAQYTQDTCAGRPKANPDQGAANPVCAG